MSILMSFQIIPSFELCIVRNFPMMNLMVYVSTCNWGLLWLVDISIVLGIDNQIGNERIENDSI